MAGGTPVTITGTHFFAGAGVLFGGVAATNVSVVNDSTITAITPAHAPGTVNVTVVNADGEQPALPNGFTYLPPQVQSVSPPSGAADGGTAVTIIGTSFEPGATVTFGGAPATSVTVVNASQITAVTPAYWKGGLVDVTVKNPDGTGGTLATGFMYVLRPGPVQPGAQPAPAPDQRVVPGSPGAAPAPVPIHR